MTAAQNTGRPYVVLGSSEDDDWADRRHQGIGASEIAVVMGESQWQSILELYYKKTGEWEPEDEPENEWLFWGKALEDVIQHELASRAGARIDANMIQPHLRSTVHRWALATPDAMTVAGEPIEAKNVSWGYDAEEWAERIPEKYYLQTQQQMLVTGASRCLFGALLWGSKLIWEWVPRDETTIARVVKAGAEFWSRVERRDPPLSDGHPGARHVLGKFATVENEVELFEPEIEEMLSCWQNTNADLKGLRAQVRKLEKQRDAAMDVVAQKMGSYRRAFTATGWSFRWETENRRGFTVEPKQTEKFKIKAPKAQ